MSDYGLKHHIKAPRLLLLQPSPQFYPSLPPATTAAPPTPAGHYHRDASITHGHSRTRTSFTPMSPTPLAAGLCTCHHAQSRRLPPCRYHVEGRISFSGGLVNLFDGVALCILNRAMKKRYLWKHPIGGNTVATVEDEEKAMGEHLYNTSPEDLDFVPRPPYFPEVCRKPYPKGYETLRFSLFDGRKVNPKEHINRFLDMLGQYSIDKDLRLREFLKSLTDRAYTWYTALAPGSVWSWEEMASRFCRKCFQNEERITTITLSNTRHKQGDHLVDYVRRFRDLVLDCYNGSSEEELVEICINNIILEYRMYLENVRIKQFSKLLEAARRTSSSVKITSGPRNWKENREVPHSLAISDRLPRDYPRERRESQPEHYDTPLPAPSGWGDGFEPEKGGLKEVSVWTETLRPEPAEGVMPGTDAPPSGSGMHILRIHELLGHHRKAKEGDDEGNMLARQQEEGTAFECAFDRLTGTMLEPSVASP
ncbi:hypothetical protein L484_004990 [Morus notabilis]|uniref:Retrotransposon gag domain-containing protein n=1 Tax=Morus notabilis TaxID=981085 RepID=W9S6H5_9ROSA|nr:hypothetical protein L484_004990 [Morus notabilis]